MTAEHGTYARAQVHIREGEPLQVGNSVCEPCRLARNDYMAQWRRHTDAPGEVGRIRQRRAAGRALLRLRDAFPQEYERFLAEELER